MTFADWLDAVREKASGCDHEAKAGVFFHCEHDIARYRLEGLSPDLATVAAEMYRALEADGHESRDEGRCGAGQDMAFSADSYPLRTECLGCAALAHADELRKRHAGKEEIDRLQARNVLPSGEDPWTAEENAGLLRFLDRQSPPADGLQALYVRHLRRLCGDVTRLRHENAALREAAQKALDVGVVVER